MINSSRRRCVQDGDGGAASKRKSRGKHGSSFQPNIVIKMWNSASLVWLCLLSAGWPTAEKLLSD